jgi:hypothetical protein
VSVRGFDGTQSLNPMPALVQLWCIIDKAYQQNCKIVTYLSSVVKYVSDTEVFDLAFWHCLMKTNIYDWLYSFFWVVPRHLNFMWNRQCVPKCRHIKFTCQGITQKKEYSIQNLAKV